MESAKPFVGTGAYLFVVYGGVNNNTNGGVGDFSVRNFA